MARFYPAGVSGKEVSRAAPSYDGRYGVALMSRGVLVALLALATAGCSRGTRDVATAERDPWPLASLPRHGWVEVPLVSAGTGLLTVEAEVQGQKVLLLLDSGAATLALDRQVAERLGLRLEQGQAKAVGLGAVGVAAPSTRLPSLKVGPFASDPVVAVVLDLAPVNKSRERTGGRPVDGVLGADFLDAHGAVIDYPHRRLYLKAPR
jgi:predicted aspartyl protease